jgi:hypothetical protein
MKKTLLFVFLFPALLVATPDSTILKLYLDADYVAHIKLGEPVSDMGFYSDMGTTWYRVKFTPVEVHKQRDTVQLQEFFFVHYGYELPNPGLWMPGTELIVFLARSGMQDHSSGSVARLNPWEFDHAALIKDGAVVSTTKLNKQIRSLRHATSFDRAVTDGRWGSIERKIKRKVNQASRKYGKETGFAVKHVNRWLGEHHTVDEVAVDSCAIHISIFPGWVTTGIRFLSDQGPKEYSLTETLGKSTRWKYWFRWAGFKPSRNKLYFKSFVETPEVLQTIDQTCKSYYFERRKGWQRQEDVEIILSLLDDTVRLLPGVSPLIRVKLTMINRSMVTRNILWPDRQNNGYKILNFKLITPDGHTMEEDDMFLMTRDESIWPSIIPVAPGDSLVAFHSINDPYGFATDITANHAIPFLNENDYLISVIYKPLLDGDTTRYWNPASGQREVFCRQPFYAGFSYDQPEPVTLNVMMIEKGGGYTNHYGQHCVYNGLVVVMEAPEECSFMVGDTIAYRFPYTMYDEWQGQDSRPAFDAELAEPGNVLQIDVNCSFPYDLFYKSGTGILNNVLLTNMGNAVRIIWR